MTWNYQLNSIGGTKIYINLNILEVRNFKINKPSLLQNMNAFLHNIFMYFHVLNYVALLSWRIKNLFKFLHNKGVKSCMINTGHNKKKNRMPWLLNKYLYHLYTTGFQNHIRFHGPHNNGQRRRVRVEVHFM